MQVLLDEMKARGPPDPDNQDIASQLYRVLKENPDVDDARVLSEIGILFVEGFETTGARVAGVGCEGFGLGWGAFERVCESASVQYHAPVYVW